MGYFREKAFGVQPGLRAFMGFRVDTVDGQNPALPIVKNIP